MKILFWSNMILLIVVLVNLTLLVFSIDTYRKAIKKSDEEAMKRYYRFRFNAMIVRTGGLQIIIPVK